jgi:hypothetical protein
MAEIPCIKVPEPVHLSIALPFGGQLSALADISKGPPSDCALVHSLMLQLAPTLAGMTCFFRVLNVIKALADVKTPPDIVKVASAAAEMAECFNVFVHIPKMIKDILEIIIRFLHCIITAIKSILNFQLGIDLNSAEGNPVLLASLRCAQDNAETTMAQMMEALAVVQPLLDMVSPLLEMGGLSLTLPSMGDLTGAEDMTKTLESLESTLVQLQEALDAIPL